MIVLGIDPGSQTTGYGVVERKRQGITYISHGEIKANKKEPFSTSLKNIYNNLNEIINKFSPDAIALEDIFYGKNIKSLIKLGHVRGVAILAASQSDIPIFEYTPLEVKKAVVGYGRAEKSQVQKMVKAILKLNELPPADASDALAVAICHINFLKVFPV
ncbi:MAG: crossover junction endodeoxyribonuclease RuvC [Deltaproteobacteria bacterium]|nr:crossover junction endodeoxyribonuclease RuvC [Deltaproteobacteria bacterium]